MALTVGVLVSIDAKLAKQMRSSKRWPVGLPLNSKITILAQIPHPGSKGPQDPMNNFTIRFPGGRQDELSQMFLCPDDPPFVGCSCAWHPN